MREEATLKDFKQKVEDFIDDNLEKPQERIV
jgi:hypothetical protein